MHCYLFGGFFTALVCTAAFIQDLSAHSCNHTRPHGQQFAKHSHVNHSQREYSRGGTHSNTAESFSSIFERARIGVFHFFSDKHLSRYLNEAGFRWDNRVPIEKKTKTGKVKIKMVPILTIDMILLLIMRCFGAHLKRTKHWGLQGVAFV